MKKLRLLLLPLLTGAVMAHAQYFQTTYGTPILDDVIESGVNSTIAQGHVMTGYTTKAGVDYVTVTFADKFGDIGAPYFSQAFMLYDNSGVQVSSRGRGVLQCANGDIIVCGDYSSTATGPSDRFFLLGLNSSGGVIFSNDYSTALSSPQVEVTAMAPSLFQPNYVYVCGWVMTATLARRPIVMCLDLNTGGAVVWSRMYPISGIDWYATDLVESPYGPRVALVGHLTNASGIENGCFFTVSIPNGAASSAVRTYGKPNEQSGLDAIAIANSPTGIGPGFVTSGYLLDPMNGDLDSWIMKFDPNGATIDFSTQIEYSGGSVDDRSADVIERFSAANNWYEYYVGSTVVNGVFGQKDEVVTKLTFSGTLFPNGEYTYGGPLDDDFAQLDQYDSYGPNSDGLSVFGTTSSFTPGPTEGYLVTSYFSGESACNFNVTSTTSGFGPGNLAQYNCTVIKGVFSIGMSVISNSLFSNQICFASFINGASNARMASAPQEADNSVRALSPNPVSRTAATVHLQLNEGTEGEAQLELLNALGQTVWIRQESLTGGQAQLEISLGDRLESGVYLLILRRNGTISTNRVVVQ